MKIAIIGTGLIGGSLAIALRDKGIAQHIIGVDHDEDHLQKAKELKLIDEAMLLHEAIEAATLIVLTVPVNVITDLLPLVLDSVNSTQIVMDMGSTKNNIIRAVMNHPARSRFVATHPMWGTEHSGPQAAVKGAFINRAAVICNKQESDADAVDVVENLYKTLGMHLVYMDADAHDMHAAYVSHVSHITSFALANTVLEKEKEEDAIFELASGGFESTVRLAKSHAAMWVPIFKQNRDNVLDVLNEHISQLKKFKACLEKDNYEYLQSLIEHANQIRRILK